MTGKVFNKVDNMRAILTALLMTIASQAAAECGKLCDDDWWKTATTANVQAELSGGALRAEKSHKWRSAPSPLGRICCVTVSAFSRSVL
jgi:hypothetical protein